MTIYDLQDLLPACNIKFGWHLSPSTGRLYGWHAITPAGQATYLGRNPADAKASAERLGVSWGSGS